MWTTVTEMLIWFAHSVALGTWKADSAVSEKASDTEHIAAADAEAAAISCTRMRTGSFCEEIEI